MSKRVKYFLIGIMGPFNQVYANFIVSKNSTLSEYGYFSIYISFMGVLTSIILFGQATSLSIYAHNNPSYSIEECLPAIKKSNLIIFIVLFIASIAAFILNNIQQSFSQIDNIVLVVILVTSFFTAHYLLRISMLQAYDYSEIAFKISTYYILINIILISIYPNFYGYCMAVFVGSIVVWLSFNRSLNFHLIQNSDIPIPSVLQMIKYGIYSIPGMFLAQLAVITDKFIIKSEIDIKAVAIYAMATLVGVNIARTFLGSIYKKDIVDLMQHYKGNKNDEVISKYKKIELTLIVFSVLAVITYILVPRQILINIFGNNYNESINLMPMLCLGMAIEIMASFVTQETILKGRHKVIFINSTLIFIINALICYFFSSIIGLSIFILCYFIGNIFSIILLYMYNIKIYFPLRLVMVNSALLTYLFKY